MSLLAMDTSSLFDPFEFPPPEMELEAPKPEPKFREKLEIKTARHQDHQLKALMAVRESESKSRELLDSKSRQHDMQPKVQMLESPPPTSAPGASDMQSVRQKLRDSLTSALEMVVSKQLVKSVLGVGTDTKKEPEDGKSSFRFEGSRPASLSQELGSPKASAQIVESLVVDLGPLETEVMNNDSIGGDVTIPEGFVNGSDSALGFEQAEFNELTDVSESPFKKLKTEFGQFDYVHRKLEIEEKEGRIAVEDVKGGIHIMDQARELATEIEAELFKLYGFKKTYNQKARSLLFNLKDKTNPELRARVFSGEIPPADLCRMSAEQLASKELSDWRNAKEQALDKMVVLTDADTASGKVVKKTHKGEFVVDVQNESTVDIIPVVTRSVFPVNNEKIEDKSQQEAPAHLEEYINHSPNRVKYGSPTSLKRSRSEEIHRVDAPLTPYGKIGEEPYLMESTHFELTGTDTVLPTIMTLDEYIEAQEDDGGVQEDVFEDAPIEPRASTTPSHPLELQRAPDMNDALNISQKDFEEKCGGNHAESPGLKYTEASQGLVKQLSDSEKSDEAGVAWAGQIQLSGSRQSPFTIIHRSGETVDLKSWPKSLELKGRVRLAHLDKFLQELQQSRSRTVTVVSLFVQDGHTDHGAVIDHVKEIASQYQMGDRVGFVEPRSGFELYLLPPGSGTIKLLSEHGHPEISSEAHGRELVLVGVIVWRRSHLSSSSRLPDRNNNVKRHAVPSSTHHESISKSSRAGVGSSKDPSSDPRSKLRGGTTINVSSALSSMHSLKFQVESPTKEEPTPLRNWPPTTTTTTSNANVLNSHHIPLATNNLPPDATTDMPPGFTVRQPGVTDPSVAIRQLPSVTSGDAPPGFWPRPPQHTSSRQPHAEDDDDLPEFDFSVQSVAGGLPRSSGQFPVAGPPPQTDTSSHLSSQFSTRQSPAGIPELGAPLTPSNPEFPSAGYPPRPTGPPPPQDPVFHSRNTPPYFNPVGPVASSMSVDGRSDGEFRSLTQDPQRVSSGVIGQGQTMLTQPGPMPQPPGVAQFVGVNTALQASHGAPPPGNAISRNDLPEWRPAAQFQLRPPPLYENDPRHMGGAPPRPHFDTAGAPSPLTQELTWPPPQQHHQQHPPSLLPPSLPPQFMQEQPRGHFQPQWPVSTHYQQQHMPVRPADPRGPFSWDTPPWDGGARSNEHRDRSSGDHRIKDPRTSELSWHERERDSNGGRPDFRRR